jgi:hypothetical protein
MRSSWESTVGALEGGESGPQLLLLIPATLAGDLEGWTWNCVLGYWVWWVHVYTGASMRGLRWYCVCRNGHWCGDMEWWMQMLGLKTKHMTINLWLITSSLWQLWPISDLLSSFKFSAVLWVHHKVGSLDEMFNIFDNHSHLVVIVGDQALWWMAVGLMMNNLNCKFLP